MGYAPHPLRLRSAPSPQGEGMKKGNNIAFPRGERCRRTATNEGRSLFSVIKNYIEFETAPHQSTSLTASRRDCLWRQLGEKSPPRGSLRTRLTIFASLCASTVRQGEATKWLNIFAEENFVSKILCRQGEATKWLTILCRKGEGFETGRMLKIRAA